MEQKTEFAVQGTDEWLQERLGKATASRFKDVLAVLRNGGESASRRNYRAQLVVERLTGKLADHFKSAAMEWGTETEEVARLAYKLHTGNEVEEAGFYQHKELQAGASPDGLIHGGGVLEIKCRNTANHIDTLRNQRVPSEYIAQIQGQMWIMGAKFADFVSYDPVMPENAQIFVMRVDRDDEYIENLSSEVADFLEEVEREVAFVREYRG